MAAKIVGFAVCRL